MTALSTSPPSITHAEDAIMVSQTALDSIFFPWVAISSPRGNNNARRATPNQNGKANEPVISILSASLVPSIADTLSHTEYPTSTAISITIKITSVITRAIRKRNPIITRQRIADISI